jgi:HKD family nuclease
MDWQGEPATARAAHLACNFGGEIMVKATKQSSTNICIQDPEWDDSRYLLEEILVAAKGASSGVGAFAFASAAGINLLLKDLDFAKFLSKAPFELVVGIDAITDTNALDALSANVALHPNLTTRVFFGSLSGSTFHPKMCWFRQFSRGTCLVGSGNLTAGGLRGNYEAFSVSTLSRNEMRKSDDMWQSWSLFHAAKLLPLDDPNVRNKAKENSRKNRILAKEQREILVEGRNGSLSVGRPKSSGAEVLIAEIPRSGTRWNQANFDLHTFNRYFGATPGKTQRIILTHIDSRGTSGPQEVRPSVSVKSHNYRFELDAAANLDYPTEGRPIAIFVKVATRTFRYRLLLPGTLIHSAASKFLDREGTEKVGHVRRFVTDIDRVRRTAFFRKLAD